MTTGYRSAAVCLALMLVLALGHSSRAAGPLLSYTPIVGAVTDTGFDVHLRTTEAAQVQVRIGRKTNLPVATVAASDFTARIPVRNLQPKTEYTYEILLNGVSVLAQTVRTFPSATAAEPVRLAVFADANINGDQRAYVSGHAENADAILQIGDFPHGDPARVVPLSITNWWGMHREVLMDSFFGPAISSTRSIPFVHIWDDHDYGDNNASGTATWKPIAHQAFEQYFPSYVRPNPEAGFWQSFHVGSLVDVIVLDERSQKDKAGETDGPKHSILDGKQILGGQKAWLLAQLKASKAPWKIVISSLAMNPSVPKTEGWVSFPAERDEIVGYVHAQGITGVVVVSGDIHSGGGIDRGMALGLPEVTVPKTNFKNKACTGGDCGVWSEGVIDPNAVPGGYALLEVGIDRTLTITIKNESGVPLKVLRLFALQQ